MHIFNPEIAWHNRDPVYSIDIQSGVQIDEDGQRWWRLASAGVDLHVLIWKVAPNPDETRRPLLSVLADLNRHERSINVVRFAPVSIGNYLASADDCGHIFIWKYDPQKPNSPPKKRPSPEKTTEATPPKANVIKVKRIEPTKIGPVTSMITDTEAPKPAPSQTEAQPDQVEQMDVDIVEVIPPPAVENRPEPLPSSFQTTPKSSPKRIQLVPSESSAVAPHPPNRPDLFGDENTEDVEAWGYYKILRGHLEDVVDICWCVRGETALLVSGSVDNSAIVWDVFKGTKLAILSGHKSWVQGVAFDPLQQFLTTICVDRSLRIFRTESLKMMRRIERAELLVDGASIKTRLFYDDTLPSFSRRMSFSPAGEFLLVPAGFVEMELTEEEKVKRKRENEEKVAAGATNAQHNKQNDSGLIDLDESGSDSEPSSKPSEAELSNDSNKENASSKKFEDETENTKTINVVHMFMRNDLSKPVAFYETKEYSVATRCCPMVFNLLDDAPNPFPFPYRIVFAVATETSVLLYDTQHACPFALVMDIHYTRLSDLTWSPDGRLLLVSSTDGYCTFITFAEGELGTPYVGNVYIFNEAPAVPESVPVPPPPPVPKPEVERTPEPARKPIDKTPEAIKNTPKIGSIFNKVDKSDYVPPQPSAPTVKRIKLIHLPK